MPAPIAAPTVGRAARPLDDRAKLLLHRLLHRDLSRCTTSSLSGAHRRGWTGGPGTGHALTESGRKLAEACEPPGSQAR